MGEEWGRTEGGVGAGSRRGVGEEWGGVGEDWGESGGRVGEDWGRTEG